MTDPDLNLLVTLDVLLAEGSVTRAGRRLRLSPSAMSRALARLRATTGDPLLVRAGRGLVPTPRALALRDRVRPLVEEAKVPRCATVWSISRPEWSGRRPGRSCVRKLSSATASSASCAGDIR